MFLDATFPSMKAVLSQTCNVDATLSKIKSELLEEKQFNSLKNILDFASEPLLANKQETVKSTILSLPNLKSVPTPQPSIQADFLDYLNSKVRLQLSHFDHPL